MICAPSNSAADNIAQRLAQIPALHGLYVRFYPEKRENLFNIDFDNLKEYSLLHKFFYQSFKQSSFYKKRYEAMTDVQKKLLQYLDHALSDGYLNSSCGKSQILQEALETNYGHIYYPYL